MEIEKDVEAYVMCFILKQKSSLFFIQNDMSFEI